jgi:hypothetical protein
MKVPLHPRKAIVHVKPTIALLAGVLMLVASPFDAVGQQAKRAAPPPPRASSGAGEWTPYVQVGLVRTEQPAGIPNHRVYPPLEGGTTGLTAAVGFFRTPIVAVEGEFVANRAISTPQQFSYDWRENYIAQSRDLFLTVNGRVRPFPRGPFELVGGTGVAISTFALRDIVATYSFAIPPRPPTNEPDQVTTDWQLTAHGGVAFPIPVSRRIDVVPAFTVRWVGRSENGIGGYAGVGSLAYHVGAALRWTARRR